MKIYATSASIIEYEPTQHLLTTTWLKDSTKLTEAEVKSEINKVLNFAKEFKIKQIIIDSRNYPFRENIKLQNWINFTYMPQIMDCGVERYAIIVTPEMKNLYNNFGDADSDSLQVEYFLSLQEAQDWVKS